MSLNTIECYPSGHDQHVPIPLQLPLWTYPAAVHTTASVSAPESRPPRRRLTSLRPTTVAPAFRIDDVDLLIRWTFLASCHMDVDCRNGVDFVSSCLLSAALIPTMLLTETHAAGCRFPATRRPFMSALTPRRTLPIARTPRPADDAADTGQTAFPARPLGTALRWTTDLTLTPTSPSLPPSATRTIMTSPRHGRPAFARPEVAWTRPRFTTHACIMVHIP